MSVKSDIEIARAASLAPIELVADKINIPENAVYRYGPSKAKISFEHLETLSDKQDGKLILVTAITPTPAGEGKTTTTVGLGDALNRIGKRTMICLREPSLGPCFGMKGGAAGGGYAQIVPMEDINLHFTGDMHAIGTANNLLAALVDNQIYWGNDLGIDHRRVSWRRVMDMNERALRSIVSSLGGVGNGFSREDGFDITVASEVMAIFCLASNLQNLTDRLSRIVVAQRRDRSYVCASDVKGEGAMSVLLQEALRPNLVQTLENNPAFVHGGPFANIAHGCNSIIATKSALKMADFVVTEAGFGADLGAEKFFDIKCRKAGLRPDAAVIVATIRALKMHGGVKRDDLGVPNVEALEKGLENLYRHVDNVRSFGVPLVVAINRFSADTDAEIKLVETASAQRGIKAVMCTHWSDGGKGAEELAEEIVAVVESGEAKFSPLYEDELPLWEKIESIATNIYRADSISGDKRIRDQLAEFEANGMGSYPVCIAKTQYSFSADANLKGAPNGFNIPVREVRLCNGAGFIVAICGEIMTMPGLPRVPAANQIHVNSDGLIEGLF